MRDIAVIGYSHRVYPEYRAGNDIEILIDPITEAMERSGLSRGEIAFTTGGSNDFLVGMAFSFERALDAIGVHPCKEDSHVEMDGAWAFYEAWVRLQLGDIDTALVWALGKTRSAKMNELMTLSVDPYYVAPLRPDPTSIAALQARALIDSGRCTEASLAALAGTHHGRDGEQILAEPCLAAPLRPSMVSPPTDGAAAIVLAAGDVAKRRCERPAWIGGIDHRTDTHSLGARDLVRSDSARIAGDRAGVSAGPVDVAELHTCFAHEQLLLIDALGLDDQVPINPSGGPLLADPVMATGLIRLGEAAQLIIDGRAERVVGHAAAGPCLQNNLVTVFEAKP